MRNYKDITQWILHWLSHAGPEQGYPRPVSGGGRPRLLYLVFLKTIPEKWEDQIRKAGAFKWKPAKKNIAKESFWLLEKSARWQKLTKKEYEQAYKEPGMLKKFVLINIYLAERKGTGGRGYWRMYHEYIAGPRYGGGFMNHIFYENNKFYFLSEHIMRWVS
jgi:hypothetical protein